VVLSSESLTCFFVWRRRMSAMRHVRLPFFFADTPAFTHAR
jgi:hypothetical protein